MKNTKIIAAAIAMIMCGGCVLPAVQNDSPMVGITAEAADSVVKGIKSDYNASKKALTITWNAVDGADAYKVSIRKSGDKDYTAYKSVKSASCSIADIRDGEKLSVKITALKKVGSSYKSLGAAAVSVTAKASTGAVTGLKVTSAAQKAVSLEWKPVSGAEKYIVYYKTTGSKNFKEFSGRIIVTSKKVTAKIDGLSKNTEYTFKVVAAANNTEGKAAEVKAETKGGSSGSSSSSSSAKGKKVPIESGHNKEGLSDFLYDLKWDYGFDVKEISVPGDARQYEIRYNKVLCGTIHIDEFGDWESMNLIS